MLEIKNLSIKYRDELLVSGDIRCQFGKITALTGESGVGKTTVLKIIAGESTVGEYDEYSINGLVVSGMSQQEKLDYLNRVIFYIDQDSCLLNSMSCLNQLMLQQKMNTESTNYTIEEILNIVQLTLEENTVVSQLSNGERQRLMIALALARDSSIILCDESTSSLDKENKENIFNILQMLASKFNKMIILVSHDNDIYEKCDCVYTIENQKILLRKCDYQQEMLDNKREIKKIKSDNSIINHIIKSRIQKNWLYYLISCCIIAFIVILLVMGKQASTQYSRHVKYAQGVVAKNQIYVINYGIDHTILNDYKESYMPFEKEMVEYMKNNEFVDAAYPLYCFNVGRFINVSPNEAKSSSCSIVVNHNGEINSLKLDKNRLNNYIFSYYPEDYIENSCDYYNEEVEGIILDYQISKTLGIKEVNNSFITLTVYIPVALVDGVEQITTSDGLTYEINCANSEYVPVEMTLPVKGILSKAHINLSECFGYMDYQLMENIFLEQSSEYSMKGDEYLWSSNTYSIYVEKDNINSFYTNLIKISNNYGLLSMQKAAADLMAPWTSLEKPFKIYTFSLACLAFILVAFYSFIKNKTEKRDYSLLKKWGIPKFSLTKIILYESLLSFIVTACISLVGIFIGLKIGLSQGWYIRGFDFIVAVKENYLIAVGLSLLFVFLSNLTCLVSVQRYYYD